MTVREFGRLQAQRWLRLYGRRFPELEMLISREDPERFIVNCLRCASCKQFHMTRMELRALLAPIDDFELALRALQHEMLARTEKADCLKKVQWLAEVFGIEKDNTPQS